MTDEQIDVLWETLKDTCCKKPSEAQMIVFLTKAKFNDAMGRWLARYGIQDKNDSQGLEMPANASSGCTCAGNYRCNRCRVASSLTKSFRRQYGNTR